MGHWLLKEIHIRMVAVADAIIHSFTMGEILVLWRLNRAKAHLYLLFSLAESFHVPRFELIRERERKRVPERREETWEALEMCAPKPSTHSPYLSFIECKI